MNLKNLLMYPFQDKDWVKKLLFGCVVSLVPVLNILTLGYFLVCTRMGISGHSGLPEWEDWGEYVRQGFMAFIIAVIYLLIPILLALPLISVPVVGVFLLAIVVLLIGLLIPIALVAYSERQDFMDAFRIKEILGRLSRILHPYVAAYLLAAFVVTLGLSMVLLLPYLAFLGVLLIFYCGVVFFYLLGSIWN